MAAVLAPALAVLAGCGAAADPPAPVPFPSAPGPSGSPARTEVARGRLVVTVKKVVDGDTLLVGGLPEGTALVRLIGINAPETGNGRTIRECFGREAARWLEDRLARGSRVSLAYDVGARDRFGRRLAYVYGPDQALLNAALVENGYAQTMTIPPNVRHADELRALERQARGARRGLWGACPDAGRRR